MSRDGDDCDCTVCAYSKRHPQLSAPRCWDGGLLNPLPITHPCDREPVRAIVLRFAEFHSVDSVDPEEYLIKRDDLARELARALRP